jgi:hypothetical protein
MQPTTPAFLTPDAMIKKKVDRKPPRMLLLTPVEWMRWQRGWMDAKLEPCLTQLLGQTDNAIVMRNKFSLLGRLESAIDRVVEFDFACWCIYLLHPGQAIGSFLHRENFARILFDVAVTFPKL